MRAGTPEMLAKPRPQAGARGRRRSAMKIFLLQGTKQLGPYSADEIRSRITSGEVALSTLASAEGMQDWVPVSEILLDGVQSSPPLPISTPIEISICTSRIWITNIRSFLTRIYSTTKCLLVELLIHPL